MTEAKAKYCSVSCARKAFNELRKERREDVKAERGSLCLYCQKKIYKPIEYENPNLRPSRTKRLDSKYCCDGHRVLACLARKQKAEN
jgi:hypothetical protein